MSSQKRTFHVCTQGPFCCKLKQEPTLERPNPPTEPEEVLAALQAAITDQKLSEELEAAGGGCLGLCGFGPNVLVPSGGRRFLRYRQVTPADAAEIVQHHAKEGGERIERLLPCPTDKRRLPD